MDFESFYTYLSSEKRYSKHTTAAYQSDLTQFSDFCDQSYGISDILEVTPAMVRTWIAYLIENDVKPASVHRKMSALNSLFRFLMKSGRITQNPAKGLNKPKIPKRLPQFVEQKAMEKLYEGKEIVNDFPTLRGELVIKLLYETGIRRAELIGIKEQDVDFYSSNIRVLGKRNKMRIVPVGKPILELISRFMELKVTLNKQSVEGYLLLSDKGQKISNSLVYQTVKSYLSTVTTQTKRSPHILRHSFATHMLNNGADLNVIKELLGHSNLAATQVYTHNTIEKLKGVHKLLHPRSK